MVTLDNYIVPLFHHFYSFFVYEILISFQKLLKFFIICTSSE